MSYDFTLIDYALTRDNAGEHFTCSCGWFEGYGLICPHIFYILYLRNIKDIPPTLVNQRWCREEEDMSVTFAPAGGNNAAIGLLKIRLWSATQSVSTDPRTSQELMESVVSFMESQVVEEAEATMESITGITLPPTVMVQLPAVTLKKGQRRKVGEREKAIAIAKEKKASKPKTWCSFCMIKDHHDARSCPLKIQQRKLIKEAEKKKSVNESIVKRKRGRPPKTKE